MAPYDLEVNGGLEKCLIICAVVIASTKYCQLKNNEVELIKSQV